MSCTIRIYDDIWSNLQNFELRRAGSVYICLLSNLSAIHKAPKWTVEMLNNAFLAASFKSYYECSRYARISASYLAGAAIFQVLLVVLSNFDAISLGQCGQEHHTECEYRNVLYRFSFSVAAAFLWLYLSESTFVRKLVATNLRWVCSKVNDYRKRIASLDAAFGCVSFALVFLFTPNGLLEVYITVVAPGLGVTWLVYEGYVAISLACKAHSVLIKTVLSGMMHQTHDMRLYLQTNARTTSGADSDVIRRARLLTVVYTALFAIAQLYAASMYYADLFPSTLSTLLVCTNVVLGSVATYVSLQSVVNQSLLVPSVFLLFTNTLCLQVLLLDPANPHNTEYHLAVRPPAESVGDSAAVYDSYSALLQCYMYANDTICAVVCLLAVYHSAVYGAECTPVAILSVMKRMGKVVSKVCTGGTCRNSAKYDKTEDAPLEGVDPHNNEVVSTDRLSLRRGASGSGSSVFLEGIEDGDTSIGAVSVGVSIHSDTSLHSKASSLMQEHDEEDGLIRGESVHAESAGLLGRVPGAVESSGGGAVCGSSGASDMATSAPMGQFYMRMMLLAAYTPLLLTRWGAMDSVGVVSEQDYRVFPKLSTLFGAGESTSVSDRIASQYTMIALLLIAYVAVWCMYAFSLYCVHEVNAKYLAARRLLFQRDTYVDESSDEEDAGDLDLENHGESSFV